MEFRPLGIAGAYEIRNTVHGDDRGEFAEWFRFDHIEAETGYRFPVRQANVSRSSRGVVRGIHFCQIPPGQAKLERAQGAFVSDDEVESIVGFCANQSEQKFEESIQQVIESGGSGGEDGAEEVSDADEETIERCIEVLKVEGKASTSLLQRRLRLGYTRAARMIDILETRGIVGPADGARPRDVLIPGYADE